jgi:hypothetical protein
MPKSRSHRNKKTKHSGRKHSSRKRQSHKRRSRRKSWNTNLTYDVRDYLKSLNSKYKLSKSFLVSKHELNEVKYNIMNK